MAATWTMPDGTTLHLNDSNSVAQVLQSLNTQINALQQAQTTQFVAPRNLALSTATHNHYHHDNPPAPGHKDIKTDLPDPFSGNRQDAEKFVQDWNGYFDMNQNKFRLSKSRIMVFCKRLKVEPSKTWAASVEKAINENDGAAGDYYDEWDNFKDAFLRKFGIINKQAYAMNRFVRLQQGPVVWETFFTEFDRLRKDAQMQKDQAFYQLQKATNPSLRNTLMNSENPPDTYDAWVTAAARRTQQTRQARDFNNTYVLTTNTLHRPAHNTRSSHDLPPGDPMDIDVFRTKKTKGKTPAKKPNKPKAQAPPQPSRPKPSIPTGSSGIPTSYRHPPTPRGVCFRCQKPGHMAVHCREPLEKLGRQRINQLLEVACSINDIPLDEEEDESQEEDTPTQEDDDLISFDDEVETIDDQEDF